MTGYRLVTDRFLHLKVDGKGKVKAKKRYFKGDVIEGLTSDEAERLLGLGSIVEVVETDPPEDEEVVPDLGSVDDDESDEADEDEDSEEGLTRSVEDVQEDNDDADDPQDEEVEDYTSLAYPALQAAAKSRGLNAGGSAADLIERLKQDDADKA